MKVLLSTLFFILSISGYSQRYFLGMKKPVVIPSNIEARINLSLTAKPSATYNNFFSGNGPADGVISGSLLDITGASTGWTFSSVATTSTWGAFSGFSAFDDLPGTIVNSGTTLLPSESANIMESCWFSYGQDYNASFPQFRISGLNTSTTYEITLWAADGTNSFDADPIVTRVSGSSTSATQDIAANTSTLQAVTFTMTPNGSGEINGYLNKSGASSEYIVLTAIRIKAL